MAYLSQTADMPKVLSVIIPSYNVQEYLSDTLESLIASKNLGHLDVIIVNDGSVDKTEDIGKDYATRYPESIRVITKQNGGHGSTINAGLKESKGKYIVILDGDDWFETHVLDEFVEYLAGVDYDLLITGHYRDYMDTGTQEYRDYPEKRYHICDIEYALNKGYRFPMTDICYKTEILKKMDLKIQEHTFYVDEEYCTLPFAHIKTICFFNKGFYHYRFGNPNQSVSLKNTIARIDHRIRVFERLYDAMRNVEINTPSWMYFRNKLNGLAKAILLIYYVQFTDKKEGREKGDNYYNKIKEKFPLVLPECKKRVYIFKIINRFPILMNLFLNKKILR